MTAPTRTERPRASEERLHSAFERLRLAFDREGGLPLEERRRQLKILRRLVAGRAADFAKVISDDFGGRSPHETAIAETGVLLAAIDHAASRLARWAKPQRVRVGWRYWPARGFVLKEPLGVVGVLAPWNYPLQLSLMPVVAALAAGCRALVKPSELAPATADLLAEAIGSAFEPEMLAVVTGGPQVAAAMSRLPFDSLIFTGSGQVGRRVMAAAAENLTPLVMELGGKSPAIIDRSADLAAAARSVVAGKLLNAGQTCVAPDYVLVPSEHRDAFVACCKAAARELYPDPASPDYTAVRGEDARRRLLRLRQDGSAVPLFDRELPAPRLTPTLLLDPAADSTIMREEIFGPLLPVISYGSADEAIAAVNSRPAALALYWFGRDRRALNEVLRRTRSGGVAVNETVLQAAVEALPFGGVEGSGFGAYHGRAGFDAFSHRRSVLIQSRWSPTRFARPPYGAHFERLTRFLLR